MALNVKTSIVDFLKSQGKDSSFSARAKLAQSFGIQNYRGTAAQNTQLLGLVSGGVQQSTQPPIQTPIPTPTPTATPSPAPAPTPTQVRQTPSFDPLPGQPGFNTLSGTPAFQQPEVTPPVVETPSALLTGGTDTTSAFIKELIKNNVFIQEQLKDPKLRALFDGLLPEMKPVLVQLLNTLGKSIEAGKVVNPDIIRFGEAQLQEFMDKAVTELDPFFQEQIGLLKGDLETSLGRLEEDFQRSVSRAEEPFKEGLLAQDEAEAQAGTTFGSERGKREQRTIQRQQDAIDDALRASSREAERLGKGTERTIGSAALGGLTAPSLRGATVSRAGFTPGERSLSFSPQGNLLGELPKQFERDIRIRKSELEADERRNRILDASNLS